MTDWLKLWLDFPLHLCHFRFKKQALAVSRYHKGENVVKAAKEAGITYTILKHNLYMDMLPMFVGDKVLETGIIHLVTDEGHGALMTRADMAGLAFTF